MNKLFLFAIFLALVFYVNAECGAKTTQTTTGTAHVTSSIKTTTNTQVPPKTVATEVKVAETAAPAARKTLSA